MQTRLFSLAAAALIGTAFLAPVAVQAADLKTTVKRERRAETRAVRRVAKKAGPVYVSSMLRRCTTRVRREWRDERWQLRSAQFCPGNVPDPFLAVGDVSVAYDPLPNQPVRFRLVTGEGL